jgi:menaquinone-9 beta-reductase
VSFRFDARYDLVIIGARCAGAAFAAFASRAGARVLLVDRAALPSDLVLSTHTLHPAGARVLRRLGVLPRLRVATPAVHVLRIGRRDATLDIPLCDEDAEYCPRRLTLDSLLQDAAREAGAVVVERTTARSLSMDEGRVTGVHLEGPSGEEAFVRAGLVVGADGRDSRVARQVGAAEYLGYEAPRGIYWSYWPAPRDYGRSPDYPGMSVVNRAGVVRMAFHTEADRVLVGSAPELDQIQPFRVDALGALQRDLARDERLGSFTQGPPCEKVRGYLPRRYFLRQPVGAGWLLLGDAGMQQDFVTGNGMSEALAQAETAAQAIGGGNERLQRWWRERDVAALPMFLFGKLQGAPGTPTLLEATVLARAAKSPTIQTRFARSLAGELSPLEVVSPGQAVRSVLGGLLRGRVGLFTEFLQRARTAREYECVMAAAVTLLQRHGY